MLNNPRRIASSGNDRKTPDKRAVMVRMGLMRIFREKGF
jgi:hypothetical protein